MQSDCFGALPPREQDPAWKLQRPGQSRAQQIEAHEAEWIAKKVLCSVYRHRPDPDPPFLGVLFATGRPLKRAELAYLLLLSGSLGRRWPYPPSRSCPAHRPPRNSPPGSIPLNPSQSLMTLVWHFGGMRNPWLPVGHRLYPLSLVVPRHYHLASPTLSRR